MIELDWASFTAGAISFAMAAIGYYKAIPAVKKRAAKAKIKEGLEDGTLTWEEAAAALLELL